MDRPGGLSYWLAGHDGGAVRSGYLAAEAVAGMAGKYLIG